MDIALGYRVSTAALRELDCARPQDEELVTVTETDSCSVDAIQYVTGCTFGKGNLIYKPYGKAAFTFFDRPKKRAVRIYCHFWKGFDEGEGVDFMREMNRTLSGEANPQEREQFQNRMQDITDRILKAPESELFTITLHTDPPPASARIFKSTACASCGEWTMEIRLSEMDGRRVCPACRG